MTHDLTHLPSVLQRSWLRSEAAGLSPTGRPPGAPHASALQLARAREEQHELLAHAQPAMAFLFEQTRDTDSIVLLADAQGMLLDAMGDDSFASRAERVALRPGANWNEQWRGTNAVGTVLAEGSPVVVRGSEHYLERNSFLTCAAAPIIDPRGQLIGAIDISGDHRHFHRHTLGLARSAARMIEHRLFETRHRHSLRLRFHQQREGIGGLTEGLMALSEDGWLIGANQPALAALGLGLHDIGSRRIEQLFELDLAALLELSHRHGDEPFLAVGGAEESPFWLRVDIATQRGIEIMARTPAPPRREAAEAMIPESPLTTQRAAGTRPVNDALERFNTGDPAMQQAVLKARKTVAAAAGIALLLQGESGVGKQSFARAAHASGRWRDGPFVALDCSTLTESQIETELFGRPGAAGRLQEACNGTLFLGDVGDLPLTVQGRLLAALSPDHPNEPPAFGLICSTRQRLRDVVASGRFREDLHARLNGMTLHMPALRERQDLPALIEGLLAGSAQRPVHLGAAVIQALVRYPWPGNLRQLINALQAACALLDDDQDTIDWQHLPDDLVEDLRASAREAATSPAARRPLSEETDPQRNLRALSTLTVQSTVAACDGNLSEAARRLGISRNTLYRKLRGT